MAEEFFKTMNTYSEKPLKERVEGLAGVIEKIMVITLKIPEMVDVAIQTLSDNFSAQVKDLSGKMTSMTSKIAALEKKIASGGVAAPGGAPPPPGKPGAPPPPPPGKGGPGAPPPPPGKKALPAKPVSLRGSIMDELKAMFNKRQG